MPILDELCRDLLEEQESLDRILAALEPAGWLTPTPAAGWNVQDSLSHLCVVEELAALAVLDPPGFAEQKERFRRESVDAAATGLDSPDVALGRRMGDPAALLDRWRRARASYIGAVLESEHQATSDGQKLRIGWFGPSMSAPSFTTARIMEAWAHGTDVRDALNEPLEGTERLRHICHIGFGARAYSFLVHGESDPGDPVRMEARAPDGNSWIWGPESAVNRISGPALDIALVLTQRRHWSRTQLEIAGPTAMSWIEIAQAFAGPGTTTPLDR
jgi:uncharacterized protein (TIGR03084 family)